MGLRALKRELAMRKYLVPSAAALVTIVASSAAHADPYRGGRGGPDRAYDYGYGYGRGATETPGIDRNQAEQRALIEQGRRNGQLTRGEYYRLMEEQDRIAEMERRAKADGFADPHERRRIREAQEVAGRHIYQETHNNETRRNRWWQHRWW